MRDVVFYCACMLTIAALTAVTTIRAIERADKSERSVIERGVDRMR